MDSSLTLKELAIAIRCARERVASPAVMPKEITDIRDFLQKARRSVRHAM